MLFLSAILLKIVFVLLLRLAPLSLPKLLAMLPGSKLLPTVSINLFCCCYVNILLAGVDCWYFSLALHQQPFPALPLSRPRNLQGDRPESAPVATLALCAAGAGEEKAAGEWRVLDAVNGLFCLPAVLEQLQQLGSQRF